MYAKYLIVFIICLAFIGSSFAFTANSIQSFKLSYGDCPSIPFMGSNTKCLLINVVCNSQTTATLSLYPSGMTRDIICGTIDTGESWNVGDLSQYTQVTGTLTIPKPCDFRNGSGVSESGCYKTSSVDVTQNSSDNGISPMWFFIIIMIIVVVAFGWFFSWRASKNP